MDCSTEVGEVHVVSSEADCEGTQRITFAPFQPEWSYLPGQYLTLVLELDAGPVERSYSLASSPHYDDLPFILVKQTPTGQASAWLCSSELVDARLTARRPAGTFTPADLDSPMALCGAGSGMAPLLSIMASVLVVGSSPLHVFAASRDAASDVGASRREELADAFPGRVTMSTWHEADQGVPTASGLTEWFSSHDCPHVYLCGPEGFMTMARHGAGGAGWESSRIITESFHVPS